MEGAPEQQAGSSKGWQQSGTLVTGNRDKKVTLACDFPTAEFYTVQFGVVFPAEAGEPNPVAALALIEWSLEGNTLRRLVNIADGMAVSGMAQACKVYMMDNTEPYNGPVAVMPYVVSAQVARGSRGNYLVPPTLIATPHPLPNNYSWIVPPAGFLAVPVPQNVGITGVQITVVSSAPGPVLPGDAIVQHTKGGFVLKQYDPDAVVGDGWIPLSPGTDIIHVVNEGLTAFDLIFSVTFAIDG